MSLFPLSGRKRSGAPDLERWYVAHGRQVWRTLLRLGVPEAAVEDAVQDVFLTAHQRLATWEARAKPSTWLLGIALRVAANARRKQRSAVALSPALIDPCGSPDTLLDARQRLAALVRVLEQLPVEQREVVVLIDLEHLSAPEAAEILSVKLNTVYSRLRLGRAALARSLCAEVA